MLLKWFAVFVRRERGKVWKKQKAERLALRLDLNPGPTAFPGTLQSGGQGWAADGGGKQKQLFQEGFVLSSLANSHWQTNK